jgi:hypothetical protein
MKKFQILGRAAQIIKIKVANKKDGMPEILMNEGQINKRQAALV